jgi:hypothetical protein
MKKLVTLMLGLSLVFGAVSVAFGKTDDTTTTKKKKKGAKKSTTTS